jgi:hypothetical protein
MRLAQIRGLKTLNAGDVFDETAARAAGIHFVYPIGSPENPTGLLGTSKPHGGDIAPAEEESLQALLGIAASSIANAKALADSRRFNRELGEKVQELRALLDLVRGLTSTLEPDEVARLLVLTFTGRWAVGKYALLAKKTGHPIVSRQKGIALSNAEEIEQLIAGLPEAAFVRDLPESDLKESLLSQKAELVFPFRSSESAGGVLVLGARMGKLLTRKPIWNLARVL